MASVILARVRSRLWRENKNFLLAITGETGSGKSLSGLRMCEEIDKNFDISQCCFSPLEVIKLINSGAVKKGSAIMLDECGIGIGARNWYKQENIAFGALLQSFRHLNMALILTVPVLSFADLQARSLIHAMGQTLAIDRERKLCKVKLLFLQYNDQNKTTYRKYPRYRDSQGRIVKIPYIMVPMPSPDLVRAYEKKKRAFTKELNLKIEVTLSKGSQEKKEKPTTKRIQIEADLLENKLTIPEIARKNRTAIRYVREVRTLLHDTREEER